MPQVSYSQTNEIINDYFQMRLLLALCLVALTSCGGSGSGSIDFVGAANVRVEATPSTIDTGDRMRVRVRISDTNFNDLIIKIRYPDNLIYVPATATIQYLDDPEDATPNFNLSDDGETYLVFFFDADDFEGLDEATLEFQLRGLSILREGDLEVDADVDDPLINNDREFDISQPEFTPEDSVSIKILGEN